MRSKVRKFFKFKNSTDILCKAPFVSMSIDISGFVSPCCYVHSQTDYLSKNSDRYPQKRLLDIWQGSSFKYYRDCMTRNVFPGECNICHQSILTEQFDSVKMKEYENYDIHTNYPEIFELTLDNMCNLECIMCSSIHSSRISKREGSDLNLGFNTIDFLTEFEEFIPHLKNVVISGGEPFLSRISLDVMNSIVTINPECIISVNTNGTILSNEVKSLLNRGVFRFNLSLDSIRKETYEKIRIGACLENVLANLKYFTEYSNRIQEPLTITVCPLVLNYMELPELLEFCNINLYYIKFVHIFNAHHVALSSADSLILTDAITIFESTVFSANNHVEQANKNSFVEYIKEIKSFLDFSKKKKDFIDNIQISEDSFLKLNIELDLKMEKYIKSKYIANGNTIYESWQTRKTNLFYELPEYFKSDYIFQIICNFDEELLLEYFEKLPMKEIINYMITFGDEAIMKIK